MKKKWFAALFLICGLLGSIGCDGNKVDEPKTILDVIKKLAPSFEVGSQVLPFGLSNTFGPGAIYRKFSDGARQMVFQAEDYLPASGC